MKLTIYIHVSLRNFYCYFGVYFYIIKFCSQLIVYKGFRRHLRNIPNAKSGVSKSNLPRLQLTSHHSSNSAYPTPDRSVTSKESNANARSHNGRNLHTKPSVSKLALPSPSVSPLPPIIYDTIEVMLEPPPNFLADEPIFSKRKHSRVAVRRSKRRKLDGDDVGSPMELGDAVVTSSDHRNRLVETESEKFPAREASAEEIQAEQIPLVESEAEKEPEKENQLQESPPPSIVVDITPAPTPTQSPMHDEESLHNTPPSAGLPRLSIPSTPEPLEFHASVNVPASIAKSHESEDIDDWLMTDIEQSVDEEQIPQQDPSLTYSPFGEDDTETAEINDSTDSAPVVEELSSILANDSDFLLPRIASSYDDDPRTTVDDSSAFQPSHDHEDTHYEAAMDLDDDPHNDPLSKIITQGDPITTLIDETRMSLSGSVFESPSPPLRTLVPKPISRHPLAAASFGTSRPFPAKENSQAYDSEGGYEETPEEFARSTMAGRDPSPSKHASTSPYPRFDIADIRARRSTRRATEPPIGLRRRSIYTELPASTNPSGVSSSHSSPRSLPTPPTLSLSPVPRAVSPSFGLRTTPRPIGRPPLRPARGGLRHVNHDVDARAKLLMARPKAAIPLHIESTQYARECLDAAVYCRLPPYNLDPAEHRLLRTHINHVQVTTYLNIRNGILRLWMLNPTIAVCREEALGVAKEERHLEMAAKCHEFLVRYGYINFGCIRPPRPLSRPAGEVPTKKSFKRRKRVVIVGAGAAGLGCARQLESLFIQFADRFPRNEELPDVVVLEGRDRIGGRIYSHPLPTPPVPELPSSSLTLNSKSSTVSSMPSMSRTSTSSLATASLQRLPDPAVDLGAQIVTGFDNGNPLAPIVKRQLRLRWHHVHDDSQMFNDQDGVRVDRTEDIRAEKLFNNILDRASAFKEKIKDQTLIEGDKELMDQGKEPHGESGRQIAKVEENEAILPPMPPSPPLSAQRESPISNHPSPRHPSQRQRIPAPRALTKMGFTLKESETKQGKMDLVSHTTLGDTMKSILVDIQRFVDLSPMDLKLLNWHWANLEYGNATNLKQLSLKHWDQDDGNE